MIAGEDPVVDDPAAFAGRLGGGARASSRSTGCSSTRRRAPIEAGSYRCRLLVAITRDVAATAERMLARWRDPWAGILTSAGAPDNPVYLAPDESTRALYAALTDGAAGGHRPAARAAARAPSTGRSRGGPRRWRSGRSLRERRGRRCEALRELRGDACSGRRSRPRTRRAVDAGFDAALAAVGRVGEPIDVAVATTQGRIRVEALQSAVRHVQNEVAEHVGPGIGVTSGFNSMDGD